MGHSDKMKVIQSGSKAEGLNLKGSDLDLMSITPTFKVYQSETEVVRDGLTVPLIINTEDSQPCFTQLRLLDHHQIFKNMWEKNNLGYMLSSEQYKLVYLSLLPTGSWKIHGPCLSDMQGRLDLAFCLKCDRWIFQAEPWVIRARTAWPPSDIISKITSYGVLFVPIGIKGSINENLEWRISFSIAEKFLVYSFSHVQLLCYAMLKVFLKEIIEKHEDLKDLLCSYFLKTLMFWISEETDPNLWRPDNIIPCFNACVQRLLYCVRYSILSHYFIPTKNLFCSVINKEKFTTILHKLYENGICCFAYSDTLRDYQRQYSNLTESLTSRIVKTVNHTFCDYPNIKKIHLLYNFLHHSRSSLSGSLFALNL
ncbi:cyclic GMP-AMP synthase-like receptor [Mytilus edulis]|uniref:cyclic GMP-AMP synthase-like receptor n=1 Tax=Mytilus edulis TaxID=6550 RepID=UPI0039F0562A